MFSGGLRTKGITKQSQENMPLITVVTVVRNGEKTLEETILSVINQSYINIEYIIVDGASTDDTLEIVKKYEDGIDYWISEPDKGIYYAMNKGINLATGDWINFMNSGDKFFDDNVINDVFLVINNNDIIYGDYLGSNGITYHSPKKINKLFFLTERMVCHQVLFYRKVLLVKHPFDIEYKLVADRKQLFKCYINHASIAYINRIICIYDNHGVSSDEINFKKDSYKLLYECHGIVAIIFAQAKRMAGLLYRNITFSRK
jgi:glycosyltransferase involved in cell wall biosynthesis